VVLGQGIGFGCHDAATRAEHPNDPLIGIDLGERGFADHIRQLARMRLGA
jgi:hypothetical protein